MFRGVWHARKGCGMLRGVWHVKMGRGMLGVGVAC